MINNFNNLMNKMNNFMGFINSTRPNYNMKIDSFPKNNIIETLNNDDELLNIGFTNFTFLYNGEDIKKYKDKKIEEIDLADKSYILAISNQ